VVDPPRGADQRKRDALARLERDADVWVGSASPDGDPYLVPLSFAWDGASITLTTPEASPTARNLQATGRVRLGFGLTRDVVLVEGTVETFSRETVPSELADAFAARTNWDARAEPNRYAYFRITPRRVQAWREENELAGRDLMREGRWLV
jgi:hypothetical protein